MAIKQFFVDMPEGADWVCIGGQCPCGEGRVNSVHYDTWEMTCVRRHKMPEEAWSIYVRPKNAAYSKLVAPNVEYESFKPPTAD